jgi:hypothetical protein
VTRWMYFVVTDGGVERDQRPRALAGAPDADELTVSDALRVDEHA